MLPECRGVIHDNELDRDREGRNLRVVTVFVFRLRQRGVNSVVGSFELLIGHFPGRAMKDMAGL